MTSLLHFAQFPQAVKMVGALAYLTAEQCRIVGVFAPECVYRSGSSLRPVATEQSGRPIPREEYISGALYLFHSFQSGNYILHCVFFAARMIQ
jgi:hypothetical protein